MSKLLERANGNLPISLEEKESRIVKVAEAYGHFLTEMGWDWKRDENSKDTPMRVAKAWMNDLVSGCFTEPPKITTFPSDYEGIVMEDKIDIVSMCSHHNLAFTGTAYVAYIPGGVVVGLSKINRVVDWYARRPQIQEGLTKQIHDHLSKVLPGNKGVMVLIKANHTCCSNRGIKHKSGMSTPLASGYFLENKDGCKDEFYQMVKIS